MQVNRWTLIAALRSAAEQYEQDAKHPAYIPQEFARIRQQFEDQAKVARALMDAFEQGDKIELTDGATSIAA